MAVFVDTQYYVHKDQKNQAILVPSGLCFGFKDRKLIIAFWQDLFSPLNLSRMNNQKVNILFWIKKSKTTSNRTASLYARITIGGEKEPLSIG